MARPHIKLLLLLIISSIKYCIGPKNRNRKFDGSSHFEGYRVQKKSFLACRLCVCLSACVHYNSKNN